MRTSILRPLRLLKMIGGMNIVLEAVKAVVPAVLGISLCMVLAFTSFGIVGVSFFGGRLFRCAEDVSLARQDCVAAVRSSKLTVPGSHHPCILIATVFLAGVLVGKPGL